jgi:hypothetical protein
MPCVWNTDPGVVHYLGGGYSAAAQERREYRGDQQFAFHVVFPIRFSSDSVARRFVERQNSSDLAHPADQFCKG